MLQCKKLLLSLADTSKSTIVHNIGIVDTLGIAKNVLISEVSLYLGIACTQL